VIETPLPSPPVGRRRPYRAARLHRVLGRRDLSPTVFVLRFTREDLSFVPGQWINIGPVGRREQREYSIYSSPHDDFLEVLVKEIPDGLVSPALRRCRPDDRVEVEGPHGAFTLVEGTREVPRFLFCATGTGVSPFHCFARSIPGLEYRLLHGVRTREDFRETEAFDPERYVPCVSRGPAGSGAFPGRLSALLKKKPVDPSTYCYLCGNSDMIYEVYGVLKDQGVSREHIFAEVYF
jgi:ferredoxin--NADP+ reductase/benzoate/toluate 1,2-dioxygenase reductase subunit